MKIIVHDVVVDRGAMTKPSKQVWDWELPVLQSKFPGGLVHVHGRTFVERDSLPEAEDEFMRLERQYGVEEDTKQAHVHLAYDRGDKGVKLLQEALDEAEWNDKAEAAKAVKAARVAAAKAAKAAKALEAVEAKSVKTAKVDKVDPGDPFA